MIGKPFVIISLAMDNSKFRGTGEESRAEIRFSDGSTKWLLCPLRN